MRTQAELNAAHAANLNEEANPPACLTAAVLAGPELRDDLAALCDEVGMRCQADWSSTDEALAQVRQWVTTPLPRSLPSPSSAMRVEGAATDVPDVLFFDTGLPDTGLTEMSTFAGEMMNLLMSGQSPHPMAVIATGRDLTSVYEVAADALPLAMAALPPDSQPELAKAVIRFARRRAAECAERVQRARELECALEQRKLTERAKGILMKRQKLDEPTAHRRMQLEAQNRRISVVELARQIIESDVLLYGAKKRSK